MARPPRQAKRYLATNSPHWRRIRAVHLQGEPLCRACMALGRTTEATEVDHIDGKAARIEDYRASNLQSLCNPCHSAKTMREYQRSMGRKVVVKGCTVDGTPLDADHHWNRGQAPRTGGGRF